MFAGSPTPTPWCPGISYLGSGLVSSAAELCTPPPRPDEGDQTWLGKKQVSRMKAQVPESDCPLLWLDWVIPPHQMSHPQNHSDNYVHLLDLVFYVSPGDVSKAPCVLGEHSTTEPQARPVLLYFETGSYYVAQTVVQFEAMLPRPLECSMSSRCHHG